jgi:hypothetical protein
MGERVMLMLKLLGVERRDEGKKKEEKEKEEKIV